MGPGCRFNLYIWKEVHSMSLTALEIFGMRSVAPLLPIAPGGMPGTDPIQIKNIDGLGPVKASISSTAFGAYDGEAFTGASVGKRNIVITVGLNPDWETQTMEELRGLLYAYFQPKVPARLRFTSTHLPLCQIDGYVESMEPNIFSKDPEVQVSVVCLKPDFVAVETTIITGLTGDGVTFETFDYEGSSPTGFVLEVEGGVVWSDGIMEVFLKSPLPQVFTLIDASIGHGSNLQLSSIVGDKYVRLYNTTDGSVVNLLDTMQSTSDWPELTPGENDLAIITNAIVPQDWSLTYSARFVGL
jgi:hypothetical protein